MMAFSIKVEGNRSRFRVWGCVVEVSDRVIWVSVRAKGRRLKLRFTRRKSWRGPDEAARLLAHSRCGDKRISALVHMACAARPRITA